MKFKTDLLTSDWNLYDFIGFGFRSGQKKINFGFGSYK
jgi:hypothetical protein